MKALSQNEIEELMNSALQVSINFPPPLLAGGGALIMDSVKAIIVSQTEKALKLKLIKEKKSSEIWCPKSAVTAEDGIFWFAKWMKFKGYSAKIVDNFISREVDYL